MEASPSELTGLAQFPLWVYVCILARITPLFLFIAPTRSAVIPLRVRSLLSMGLALLLTPSAMSAAQPLPASNAHALLSLAGEGLLGLMLGSMIVLVVMGLQIAGQMLGQLAGINNTASPEEELSSVAQLLGWLAVVLILATGGHRFFVQGLLESFTSYPIGSVQFQSAWFVELELAVQHALVIGLRIAAPLALALLLANVITALVARTMPQLNVLAVGFNINALVLMTLLMVSLGSVGWVFQAELAVWIHDYQRLIAAGS